MILGIFEMGGDQMEVVIDGNNTLYRDSSSGTTTTIHGVRLNKPGVIREHPDLKDDEEWRKKAIERLLNHMKKMKSEDKKMEYVKEELVKWGYTAKTKQRAGFRPVRFR